MNEWTNVRKSSGGRHMKATLRKRPISPIGNVAMVSTEQWTNLRSAGVQDEFLQQSRGRENSSPEHGWSHMGFGLG
jgi:hypothetical protein